MGRAAIGLAGCAVGLAIGLALACGGSDPLFDPPQKPAPEPTVSFDRVAVIGASVSAGMGGGPIYQIVEARLPESAEVIGLASVWTFQAPVRRLGEQIDRAIAFKPTAVLAIDGLFWCAYGPGGRDVRVRACLAELEKIKAPLFVGDLPDMRNASELMLPRRAVPPPDELASLNRAIRDWANARDHVRLIPLSEWNKPLMAGEEKLVGLMSPDGLHPNRGGVVYILRKLAREVDGAGALGAILMRIVAALAVLAWAPAVALACSGPGAMQVIEGNERFGWIAFAVSAAVVIASAVAIRALRGRWAKLGYLLALVAVHPGWWMSARGGDCGQMLRTASIAMTAATVLLAAVIVWRSGRGATRPDR